MPKRPKIFIIEDVEDHFEIVNDFVKQAIHDFNPGLDPPQRVYTRDQLDHELREMEREDLSEGRSDAKVLVVFDLHIDPPPANVAHGGPSEQGTRGEVERMDALIEELWRQPSNTWRGTVRIVVYSALADDLRKLPRLPRRHRHIVSKIPKGLSEPFDDLTAAIQDCVSSLA
jgi:hypothetical protein